MVDPFPKGRGVFHNSHSLLNSSSITISYHAVLLVLCFKNIFPRYQIVIFSVILYSYGRLQISIFHN